MPDAMKTDFMRSLAADGRVRVPAVLEEPTPSESTRGMMYRVDGGDGVADVAKIILKAADGSFSAVTWATG